MRVDATLWIGAEDAPRLSQVWLTDRGTTRCTVAAEAGQFFAAPRDLRRWAQALLDVADEACRQEDRLTDEPLPGSAS